MLTIGDFNSFGVFLGHPVHTSLLARMYLDTSLLERMYLDTSLLTGTYVDTTNKITKVKLLLQITLNTKQLLSH